MAEDGGIVWHVETHEHVERSTDWYWGLILLTIAGAALSIFFGNALFAIVIVLAALSLGVLVSRGPREHDVRLTPRGASIDGTFYKWEAVESFWIVDPQRDPHLLLSTKGVLHPQLIVPLLDFTRAQNVRQYVRRYVEEREQEAHMGHHIAEMLGL